MRTFDHLAREGNDKMGTNGNILKDMLATGVVNDILLYTTYIPWRREERLLYMIYV